MAGYLLDSVDHARIDRWDGSEPPLIICESRTFGGVLERTLAYQYLCPVTATNGQVGGFLHTNVAPVLLDNERPVLYVGDLDPQGEDIEANTRRVLEHETGEREWRRVALTAGQAAERDLPAIEKTDRRFKPPLTSEAIEAEALGQSVVEGLVRDVLDELLPDDLGMIREREDAQREISACALEGLVELESED